MSTPNGQFGFGSRPLRSRSPAGTSTSPLTGPGCLRERHRPAGGRALARLGAKCHGAKGEGGDVATTVGRWHRHAEHRCSR